MFEALTCSCWDTQLYVFFYKIAQWSRACEPRSYAPRDLVSCLLEPVLAYRNIAQPTWQLPIQFGSFSLTVTEYFEIQIFYCLMPVNFSWFILLFSTLREFSFSVLRLRLIIQHSERARLHRRRYTIHDMMRTGEAGRLCEKKRRARKKYFIYSKFINSCHYAREFRFCVLYKPTRAARQERTMEENIFEFFPIKSINFSLNWTNWVITAPHHRRSTELNIIVNCSLYNKLAWARVDNENHKSKAQIGARCY